MICVKRSAKRLLRAALLGSSVGLLVPLSALAESAVLLGAGGDLRLPAAIHEGAAGALASLLEAEGVTVMPPAEARRRLPRALRECSRVDCAGELRRALEVDLVAGVALWSEPSADGPKSAVVTLVDAAEHSWDGTSRVDGGDVATAVSAAFAEARSRQRRGPGPWLSVAGSPAGAVVVVNGTDAGVLPYVGRLEPGEHEVRVRLAGWVSERHVVRVPRELQATVSLEVRLTRAIEPAPALVVPPERPGRHAAGGMRWGAVDRPVVGPLAAGIAGVGLLAIDVATLAMTGCSQSLGDGTCLVEEVIDPVPFASYGIAGIAAIASAVLWHLLGGESMRLEEGAR